MSILYQKILGRKKRQKMREYFVPENIVRKKRQKMCVYFEPENIVRKKAVKNA